MQTLRGFSFPTYFQLIPTHFRHSSKIAFTCKLGVIQLAPSFTNFNILTAFPLLHYFFLSYCSIIYIYMMLTCPFQIHICNITCRYVRLTSAIFSVCLPQWPVAVRVGSRHLKPPLLPIGGGACGACAPFHRLHWMRPHPHVGNAGSLKEPDSLTSAIKFCWIFPSHTGSLRTQTWEGEK